MINSTGILEKLYKKTILKKNLVNPQYNLDLHSVTLLTE